MDLEIWKSVPSRPTIKVSNLGRVILPSSTRTMPNGGTRMYSTKPVTGYVTRANKTAQHCHLSIHSRKQGHLKVHQLVCEAFHGQKPSEKHEVVHLNEDALDNRSENLRWGTRKENLNMPKFIAYCRSRTGENSPVLKGKSF
jgi:hypothetical protein